MAKVLHFSGYIFRDDGESIQPELVQRILNKIMALLTRLGCSFRADWRLGERPGIEDRLG